MKTLQTDFLVVGSGLAGLAFALKAAELGEVTVCTKAEVTAANTAMAQGGIAAVIGDDDSFEKHVQDTMIAGAGLCHEDIVRHVVEQGPERIRDLIGWGVRFDKVHGPDFALTREGGHSVRRILHFADHTGQEIHSALLNKAHEHPRIQFLSNHYVTDLITTRLTRPQSVAPSRVVGAYVLSHPQNEVTAITSRACVLATGGAGKVYLYTSNWSGATGDGIAMAYRAGARVANLEFMQFHPTCLFHPQARNFLISEALRGEGGELINASGEAFMKEQHRLGSLAPRDIVARSIDAEMKRSGAECVFLDMRHKDRSYIEKRFPQIDQKCREFGIDMSTQPIPVVPAAHYLCGGVWADRFGRSDVPGLFAIGENACSGLNGANRLASNSLLECLVFAHNAYLYLKDHPEEFSRPQETVPPWHLSDKQDSDELIVVTHMWAEIRRLMWNYVGIVRSNKRLERAQNRLANIQREITEYYSNFRTHKDIEELRNIALVAELTVLCAQKRQESRGIHFNIDCATEASGVGHDTIIDPLLC